MVSHTLDKTFGASLIAVIIAAELHGVACVQALYYYTHQKDGWPLKTLVGAVMCLETTHQAMISHTIYTYLVSDFDDPSALSNVVWTLVAEVVVNGLVTLLTQSFLTYRIWRLSKNNKWLTGAALLFVLSEFAMILVYVSNPIPWSNFSELPRVENLVIVVETLAASGDLFIAGVLCFILLRSRTGFSRSDTMIKKLVIFFINTGLLTSLFAIGSLVALTVAPTTFIYIVLFFCMGRLYSNSLLAILNARSIIRTGTDEVLTSRDLPLSLQPRSTGSMRPDANVTIRIETTHDTASDKDIKSASHPGGHFDHFSSSRI